MINIFIEKKSKYALFEGKITRPNFFIRQIFQFYFDNFTS
jgi:hypothetical protein